MFQLPVQAEGVCGEVEDAQVRGLQTVTGVAVILLPVKLLSALTTARRVYQYVVEVIKDYFLQSSAFDLKVNVDGFLLSIQPTDVEVGYLLQ